MGVGDLYERHKAAQSPRTPTKGIEMRNLKIMGLALVAVLAFSAVAASAASAAKYKSGSASGTTFLKATNAGGLGNHVFKRSIAVSSSGLRFAEHSCA